MYCDNPEYRGVRMYCRQTCNSCDEDFSAYEDPAALAGDEDGRKSTLGMVNCLKKIAIYIINKYINSNQMHI